VHCFSSIEEKQATANKGMMKKKRNNDNWKNAGEGS